MKTPLQLSHVMNDRYRRKQSSLGLGFRESSQRWHTRKTPYITSWFIVFQMTFWSNHILFQRLSFIEGSVVMTPSQFYRQFQFSQLKFVSYKIDAADEFFRNFLNPTIWWCLLLPLVSLQTKLFRDTVHNKAISHKYLDNIFQKRVNMNRELLFF